VSAVNIASNIVRTNPTLPTIGNQQTYLFYNVGDLAATLTPGSCIQVSSNGGTTSISVSFTPISGFNSSLTWQWIGLPAGLSVNIPTGSTPFSGGYAPANFVFTNNNTQDIAAAQSLTLEVTVTNGNGSANKFFPVQIYLSSTACGGTSFGAHPASSGSISINGTWKTNPGASGATAQITSHPGLPDLSIHSVDVQISPSIPKFGDLVNVRFKLNNTGDSDAKQVPIALEVNGLVVAMDTFDVAASHSTLGGLNWNSANWRSPSQNPAGAPSVHPVRSVISDTQSPSNDLRSTPNASFIASLVIDPANTIKEKSSTPHTLLLPQLTLRPPLNELLQAGSFHMSRGVFELAEGCNGARITSGSIASCGSGEVDFNVLDIATGKFSIASSYGVADLGSVNLATADASNAPFTSQVAAIVGHTYAIQLSGSRTAVFTLTSVLNPHQIEALAAKHFSGGGGATIIHQLGGSSSTSSSANKGTFVYFDLRIRTSQ